MNKPVADRDLADAPEHDYDAGSVGRDLGNRASEEILDHAERLASGHLLEKFDAGAVQAGRWQ